MFHHFIISNVTDMYSLEKKNISTRNDTHSFNTISLVFLIKEPNYLGIIVPIRM